MLHLGFLGFGDLFTVRFCNEIDVCLKLDQFPSSIERAEERLFGWVQHT
jgi:hypothetical protein